MLLRNTVLVVRSLCCREGSFHTAMGESAQDTFVNGYSCSVTVSGGGKGGEGGGREGREGGGRGRTTSK